MRGAPYSGSVQVKARFAGLLYLGTLLGGVTDLFIRSGLVVRGDAAATAAHILGAEFSWRLAVTAEQIGTLCYLGVTAIMYTLLKPVSRTLSLMAAFFSVAGCAIGASSAANLLTPLSLLGGSPGASAFNLEQTQTLAMSALRVQAQGYNMGMLCFGVYCSLLGYLVLRSSFLPRAIGLLLVLAGMGWLTDSFSILLAPSFAATLQPFILAPGFIGEASLCIWLGAFGVNAKRWQLASTEGLATA